MMDNLEVLEVNHRIRRSMWSGRKMGVGVKIGIIRSGNIVSGGRIIGEIWGEMVLGVENIVVVVNEGVWSERVWQKFLNSVFHNCRTLSFGFTFSTSCCHCILFTLFSSSGLVISEYSLVWRARGLSGLTGFF